MNRLVACLIAVLIGVIAIAVVPTADARPPAAPEESTMSQAG